MPIPQIPIFSMLRTRMQWNQERQQLLAENISNANTPKFKPRDLAPPPNSPQFDLAPNLRVGHSGQGGT
jgi:flagellar hook protein FlgE